MRRFAASVLAAVAVSTAAGALPALADDDLVAISTADMTGTAERPGPGDADATGWAEVYAVPDAGLLCYVVIVENIVLPAAAAHIHVGGPTVPGPVVIPIKAPNRAGVSAGCVHDVNEMLLQAIADNPGAYYVNVHNTPFPGGAVRGQLEEE